MKQRKRNASPKSLTRVDEEEKEFHLTGLDETDNEAPIMSLFVYPNTGEKQDDDEEKKCGGCGD